MENMDTMNWDSIDEVINPFEAKATKRVTDQRFYKLLKDESGSGTALIRFLPDADGTKILKMFKINTTIYKDKTKRFVNEWSPQSIGLPCPFRERWAELRADDQIEESKQFNRKIVYLANIKVLKDPKNPANEGKIFLLEMSNDLHSKVELAINPTQEAISLGQLPKKLFNPVKGNSFLIAARKGANGITNYNDSKPIDEVNGIYSSVDEALAEIKSSTHRLNDFYEESAYLPYEVLLDKLNYVTFAKPSTSVASASVASQMTAAEKRVAEARIESPGTIQDRLDAPFEVTSPAPKQSNDPLDDLLNSLK